MSNHNALMFAFAALLALSVPPFAAAADNTATPPGPPPPLSATQPPPGPRIPPASNIGGFVAEYQSKAFVYTEYTNMLKALKDACATGYAPIDWCTKPDVPPPQTNDDKDKREPNHTQPPSATLPALSQHIGVPHLSAIRGSRPHLQATFTWDDGSVLTVGVNATLPGAIKVTDIQEYCVFLSEGDGRGLNAGRDKAPRPTRRLHLGSH